MKSYPCLAWWKVLLGCNSRFSSFFYIFPSLISQSIIILSFFIFIHHKLKPFSSNFSLTQSILEGFGIISVYKNNLDIMSLGQYSSFPLNFTIYSICCVFYDHNLSQNIHFLTRALMLGLLYLNFLLHDGL